MSNVAIDYNNIYNNKKNAVIYDFTTRKPMGSNAVEDNVYDGNRAGKSCEVDAFRTDEEIQAMIAVYDKHINDAVNNGQRKLACRNKMLFVIGINIGLRASDLRTLTWDFFFDTVSNGTLRFRDSYNLRPKKTRKTGKYVKLYINDSVKKIINWYISMYPIENVTDYMFKSRVGNDAITVNAMWRVIKDAAKEAGITHSIGSHSLRKTMGYWVYKNAQDKNHALVVLMTIFNHSSTTVTSRYIGLVDDDITSVFDDMNLGIDFI